MCRDLRNLLDERDQLIVHWLRRYSVPFLRFGMGMVFVWFGALKFFPGLSPAADLATRTIQALTFELCPGSLSLKLLGTLETLIGLGFLTGTHLRLTVALMIFQMAGTLTPLALFPEEAFTRVPYAPTLEGQYIIKNIVLIGAGLVIGATVRGGAIVAEHKRVRSRRRPQVSPKPIPVNRSSKDL